MRDIPTSPRAKEIMHKRRMLRVRVFIISFILFCAFIWGLSYLSRDKHVVIDNFIVNGTHVINEEDIIKNIKTNISGKYFYLFAKSNTFIFPQKKIYNDLIKNFPRIESLSVNRDKLKNLVVDITERVGSSLYCGQIIPENKNDIGENCYFINNDGYIFDKAPYFSGNVYFKYYLKIDDSGSNALGKQMMKVDDFHQVARFVDLVTALGFEPIYLSKNSDGTNNLYLAHGISDTSPKIIFKDENSLEEIGDNLSVAMRKKEFADEINSGYNTLLYIDLRFDNKVLYKFQ